MKTPSDNSKVLALAESALVESWRRMKGAECFRADPVGYVKRPEDNLLSTVSFADIEQDYGGAAGHELEHKFCAAYSSAALVANCFGPFRKGGSIPIVAGVGELTSLRFEQRLSHGLRGESPNLDVTIKNAATLIAIESKCTEYLRGEKAGEFRPAYDQLVDGMEAGWQKIFHTIRGKPAHFGRFDAAQLAKHYLGIRHSAKEYCNRVLLYLFWEPLNADSFPAFAEHRGRIEEFSAMVRGSEVEFQYQTYPELWKSWASGTLPAVGEHLRQLKDRYLITLPV